jgi:phage antirepressor YoqD-like protein
MMQIQTIGAARTMSSREIAELTEKEHKHVLRDVRVMLDQLEYKGPGLVHFWTDPQSKRDYHEYLLPEDLTLTLVSGYSVQMRHRIVKRWQELEARNTPVALPDFADPVAAARAWADATESKIKAETALALAAPKVEMVDRYMDATGTQTFRQVAKLLGAKEPAFRAFLAARRILYQIGGTWTPYAEHLDAGRFVVKTGSADNGHAFSAARFTPKGVAWVSELWLEAIGGSA